MKGGDPMDCKERQGLEARRERGRDGQSMGKCTGVLIATLPNNYKTLSYIVACFLPLIIVLVTTIGRLMIMISGCMAMTMSRFQSPIKQRALAAGE